MNLLLHKVVMKRGNLVLVTQNVVTYQLWLKLWKITMLLEQLVGRTIPLFWQVSVLGLVASEACAVSYISFIRVGGCPGWHGLYLHPFYCLGLVYVQVFTSVSLVVNVVIVCPIWFVHVNMWMIFWVVFCKSHIDLNDLPHYQCKRLGGNKIMSYLPTYIAIIFS